MNPNEELDDLNEAIKKLRISYEKYFAGVERLEPIKERDQVKATLRRIRSHPINNTARRFRVQQLQATLVTHENYWNRLVRQIEDGTFKRDVRRAAALAKSREAQPSTETKPAAEKPAAKKSAKKAAGAPADPTLKKLHQNYQRALATVGNKKDVSIEALARTVEKQTAAIKKKYKCKNVEFKVAVKDGKAILKAVPK